MQNCPRGLEISREADHFRISSRPHLSGIQQSSIRGCKFIFRGRNSSNKWIGGLCVQLLVKDSSQRLPLHKVLTHPWIVNNADPSGVYNSHT